MPLSALPISMTRPQCGKCAFSAVEAVIELRLDLLRWETTQQFTRVMAGDSSLRVLGKAVVLMQTPQDKHVNRGRRIFTQLHYNSAGDAEK